MALFNLFKKKEEKKTPTCCCSSASKEAENSCGCSSIESIKVLGAGCKTCHQQYEHAKEAVRNLGLYVTVEYITDMEKIMAYGVMVMPAIVTFFWPPA